VKARRARARRVESRAARRNGALAPRCTDPEAEPREHRAAPSRARPRPAIHLPHPAQSRMDRAIAGRPHAPLACGRTHESAPLNRMPRRGGTPDRRTPTPRASAGACGATRASPRGAVCVTHAQWDTAVTFAVRGVVRLHVRRMHRCHRRRRWRRRYSGVVLADTPVGCVTEGRDGVALVLRRQGLHGGQPGLSLSRDHGRISLAAGTESRSTCRVPTGAATADADGSLGTGPSRPPRRW
jgi:hypothetical protein